MHNDKEFESLKTNLRKVTFIPETHQCMIAKKNNKELNEKRDHRWACYQTSLNETKVT